MELKCRILIVGGGISGLTIARELLKRGHGEIIILEKESKLGAHASGRNSGVLHAGIYYSPGTHKATYCVEGNKLMKQYCCDRGLPLVQSGKVIVADDESKLEGLFELKKRADLCGARAYIVDEKELKDIEPHASFCGGALYSPDTAVISPTEILHSLKTELESSGGVKILFETSFLGIKGSTRAITNKGEIGFDLFINAAGTFADVVARHFGVGKQYKVLPFKGTYKKLKKGRDGLVNGNIYPVPDLRDPFLGVHFTKGVDGDVYIGPTAIPVFGREQYGMFDDISVESASILLRNVVMMLKNKGFRAAALSETKKHVSHYLIEEASKLVPELQADDLENTLKSGIRPQLVDWKSKSMVMDFVLIKDGDSLHILNAISPAFTCSMAFAKHAVDTLLS